MFSSHSLENFLMFLRTSQVCQIEGIFPAIIEFLDQSPRPGKLLLGRSHFTGFCQFVEFMSDFSDIWPRGGLIIAEMGHVITDIQISQF